jgi:transcription initiation factor TFIIA small subunit
MSLTLYRQSTLGKTLMEVLQELEKEKKISEQMSSKVLEIFDRSICEEISTIKKQKATIKAKVTSFKNCDDIWIFYSKDATITITNDKKTTICSKLKIIACDKNMKEQLEQGKKNYVQLYNNTEEYS